MDTDESLGPIEVTRRDGREPFHIAGAAAGTRLIDFWRWSCSDLVSNSTRGVLAEFLVAQALGLAAGVRDEWAAFDLETTDGIRIEVKSAAFIQSWRQSRPSRISFSVSGSKAWSRASGTQQADSHRQADVYVFALLAHRDQASLDPMDLSHWRFHALASSKLEAAVGDQRSISLASLTALAGDSIGFAELAGAVASAGLESKRSMP